MDGEINGAANYEVKKKGAGKLIYSQIKTVRRGQWQEKAAKWTPIFQTDHGPSYELLWVG